MSYSYRDVLAAAGVLVQSTATFGPSGLAMRIRMRDGRVGSIIVTQSDDPEGSGEWLHASIAFTDEDPSYADLRLLHRAVFGRKRFAYQQFVPPEHHVDIHSHALHLFGRSDGAPVMPFAQDGTV
jgi:hypothetical protein